MLPVCQGPGPKTEPRSTQTLANCDFNNCSMFPNWYPILNPSVDLALHPVMAEYVSQTAMLKYVKNRRKIHNEHIYVLAFLSTGWQVICEL